GRRPAKPAGAGSSPVRLVVIGASTGGPPAVQAILRELPPTFPAPMIVVQHMPPVFTAHFAERLNSQCPLTVKEAEDGEAIEPGRILVVPGDRHLTVRRSGANARVLLSPRQPDDRYVPSIDRTMAAAAELFTTGVLGIVLTGMGDDGKEGMLAIKRRGGRTMAESEETAAIFGMPKEAMLAGAVDQMLPLPAIGPALINHALP
ncbi:MAG: CheB methylesterase domain-containing protein, partial [Nitrospirota bacterium]